MKLLRLSRAGWIRLAIIAILIGGLEVACRTGLIDKLTMIPPSEMVTGLVQILYSGSKTNDILNTMSNVAVALSMAIVVGFLTGVALFLLPRVRRVVDPLLATYYAIPIFVFYPFFVVLFGLNRMPQITVGFLLAVVAMIINTLNGFDRVPQVLLKTARVMRLSTATTIARIILPYAALYIATGLKLAVAYSFIGVIAAEFILAGEGIGYEISFAFNDFDNRTMYPLILLIVLIAGGINMALYAWEKRFLARQMER
ncbi:MAG: ABC transporter permease subunit [Hyphomicrobiaceae bacterium]